MNVHDPYSVESYSKEEIKEEVNEEKNVDDPYSTESYVKEEIKKRLKIGMRTMF